MVENTLNIGKISEGFVLDHIKAGKSMDIYKYLNLDQLDCCFIHLVKIIGCEKQSVLPVCTKPFDICLDGFYKLTLFFGRVCIIKTHVELAVIFLCKTIV